MTNSISCQSHDFTSVGIVCYIPLYVFSSIYVPISILRKIGKKFRSFLWGHTFECHAFHPIAWSQVCTPKSYGWLGFQLSDGFIVYVS